MTAQRKRFIMDRRREKEAADVKDAKRESIFSCPVCGEALMFDEGAYRCVSGHCFDRAKEGYVNLLPANRQHASAPGDDKDMVKARTAFLDSGRYTPLKEALCALAAKYAGERTALLDAGCGEGYYTEGLSRVIAEKGGRTGGADLSKAAVKKAAKRCREAEIAVASVYHLPLADGSVDMVTDCFSPLAKEEYRRVLKDGGHFLYVVPGARHLWEMKEVLYEQPYENEVWEEAYEGFRLQETVPLSFGIHLEKTEEIMALFRMTPYAWKTPKEGVERLAEQKELGLLAEFRILVYERR